jgi:hypothetical protein
MPSFYDTRVRPVNLSGALNAAQNITSPLGDAIGGFTRRLQEQEDRRLAQEQQAFQNNIASQRLGIAQAANQRAEDAAEQDVLLGQALSSLPDANANIQATNTIPAVTGNQAQIDQINQQNAAIEQSNQPILNQQETAGEAYNRIFGDLLGQQVTTEQFDQPTNPNAQAFNTRDVPGTSYQEYRTPDGRSLFFDPDSPLGSLFYGDNPVSAQPEQSDVAGTTVQGTPLPSPLEEVSTSLVTQNRYTPEQAHQIALQQSGLNEVRELLPTREVPELIPDTPARTEQITRRINRDEWIQQASDAIRNNADLTGSTKLRAIEGLGAQADALFGPRPKEKSLTALLALERYKDTKKSEIDTLADYRNIFGADFPSSITTVEGAKRWAQNRDKSLTRNKPNDPIATISSRLYRDITSKDAEDVEAIDEWISRNRNALATLTKPQVDSLVAQITARYNNESENFDITDYLFGGSAAGDVLNDEIRLFR